MFKTDIDFLGSKNRKHKICIPFFFKSWLLVQKKMTVVITTTVTHITLTMKKSICIVCNSKLVIIHNIYKHNSRLYLLKSVLFPKKHKKGVSHIGNTPHFRWLSSS